VGVLVFVQTYVFPDSSLVGSLRKAGCGNHYSHLGAYVVHDTRKCLNSLDIDLLLRILRSTTINTFSVPILVRMLNVDLTNSPGFLSRDFLVTDYFGGLVKYTLKPCNQRL
jgi:hypothetical protein